MASRKIHLTRRLIILALFVTMVYGGVIGFNRFISATIHKAMASAPPPVINVSTARAQNLTWAEQLQVVAGIRAVQGTTLTTQSAGTVTGIHFRSGDEVKAGTLLVLLNDNVARAQLAADQAKQLNARQELNRQRRLYPKKLTSESQLQAAEATFNEVTAAIAADKAVLSNLQVRAPFDGHLGIRQVSLGQYVSPGTGVVEIQQWDPLLVDFQIPQRDLSRVAVGDPIALNIPGVTERNFEGTITALGSSFDSTTRNLGIRATVPNEGGKLRPGMFGDVTINLAATTEVVAVPQTAITFSTYGEYVYIVQQTDKGTLAEQRIVKTGATRDDLVAITTGIQSGEEVVIEGQVNLYPGAHIKILPPSGAQREAATARPVGD